MSAEPDLLFVYGTLMHGYDHPMARRLAAAADYLGPANCAGRLYRVAHYPGLLLSDDPAERACGDLYALRGDPALLAALDDYEGCGPSDEPPHAYARQPIEVVGEGGASRVAWTYVYRLLVAETQRIVSGRFTAS